MSAGEESSGSAAEPPAPRAGGPSAEERTLALAAHLGGSVFLFVCPLVIWITKKDESRHVAREAKEALNFQITVLLALTLSSILAPFGCGCILLPGVFVLHLVFCIVAGLKAYEGESYRYPYTLRLID